MEQTTNGAGTTDWLRVTKDLTIYACVPGDHSSRSTIGITAQAHEGATACDVIVAPAPADSAS
jgi:hypothetical protein